MGLCIHLNLLIQFSPVYPDTVPTAIILANYLVVSNNLQNTCIKIYTRSKNASAMLIYLYTVFMRALCTRTESVVSDVERE